MAKSFVVCGLAFSGLVWHFFHERHMCVKSISIDREIDGRVSEQEEIEIRNKMVGK